MYTITDLGTLGGAESRATGLSETGAVAGWSWTGNGLVGAFSYDGAMVGLSAGTEARANGINSAGTVAGTVYQDGYAQATVWQGGVALQLGTLGGNDSFSTAVNDRGQVTGSASNAGGEGRAFVFDEGVLKELGTLPGWQWSSGNAINEGGQVAGTAQLANGRFRALVWNANGGPQELGTLGGRSSYGMDISEAGLVVGTSMVAGGWLHAFFWDGLTMQDLGTLGGGNSGAYGINGSGKVVGYSGLVGGDTVAFLFADGFMLDLNTLIPGSVGWHLLDAMAINNAGQIVGTGRINGELHAYRLDPIPGGGEMATTHSPEPGTWGMMLLGAGLLAVGGRRRRRR